MLQCKTYKNQMTYINEYNFPIFYRQLPVFWSGTYDNVKNTQTFHNICQ